MSVTSLVVDAFHSKYKNFKYLEFDVSNDAKYNLALKRSRLNPQIGFEPSLARILERGVFARHRNYLVRFDRIKSFSSEYIDTAVTESIHDFRSNSGIPKEMNFKQMAAAAKLLRRQLKLKNKSIKPLSNSESADTLKRSKSSSYPSFVKKGTILNQTIRNADLVVKNQTLECFTYPAICYHRVQFRKDKPKLRQIWGYPVDITILENKFAVPLINYFKNARTPYVVGLRNLEVGCRLDYLQRSYKYQYSLDWSKFDRTVPYWALKICFDLLKQCFVFNNESPEWLWRHLVKYFINTPMLTRDGKVTVKSQGVPSGSSFTNLIDSMVNLLLINYFTVGKKTYVKSNAICVMGDDIIFGSDEKFFILQFQKLAASFNMVINYDKSVVHSRGERVYFLGFDWINCLPYADLTTMVYQMIYPESFIPRSILSDRQRILARTLSISLNAVGGNKLICDIFKFDLGVAIESQLKTDNFYDLAWDASGFDDSLGTKSLAKHWKYGPLIR